MADMSEAAAVPPVDFESLKAQVVGNHVKLPKRLKQAAAYALENPTRSPSARPRVSPKRLRAAVHAVRLAHQFGYEGFSHFQTIFKERLRLRTPSL